jgi:hypothetical protein
VLPKKTQKTIKKNSLQRVRLLAASALHSDAVQVPDEANYRQEWNKEGEF